MQTVINGILTNYEVVNPKASQSIVILHGWGSNSSYWLPLTQQLSTQFRYYLLDLPGFGGTRNLQDYANIPDYTEFVKEFITKLKIKQFILIGHSFGGQVAPDYALRYPKDLNRIILIDSATVRIRSFTTRVKIAFTKLIKPITLLLHPSLRMKILSLYAPPEYVSANEYLRSVLKKILKYDLSTKLHLIKVKTDIIWGSEDKVIPYTGKLLAETISDSRLHIIYGAGHLPHLTHPKKLAAVINKILEDESA